MKYKFRVTIPVRTPGGKGFLKTFLMWHKSFYG